MKPTAKRMFSGVHEYHRFDIGGGQLETAIRLFLIDGCDMFSVITLAAAAGEILHRLVLNAGKRPFVDYVIRVNQFKNPAITQTPKRSECAIAAIIKAMADYKALTGEHTAGMQAFLGWTYKNLDSAKLIEDFKKAPEEFKADTEGK